MLEAEVDELRQELKQREEKGFDVVSQGGPGTGNQDRACDPT